MRAIVTVKLKRNPHHNPQNKQIDTCPLWKEGEKPYMLCTDSTGEHHSYLETGFNIRDIERKAREKYGHVTRVEAFDEEEAK